MGVSTAFRILCTTTGRNARLVHYRSVVQLFQAFFKITTFPTYLYPISCNQYSERRYAQEVNIAPNSFSDNTTVTYSLENEQSVAMQLLDATGKLVATPLSAQIQSEGEHQFNLEAGTLPTGMYFLVLQMGEKRETRRVILSK